MKASGLESVGDRTLTETAPISSSGASNVF